MNRGEDKRQTAGLFYFSLKTKQVHFVALKKVQPSAGEKRVICAHTAGVITLPYLPLCSHQEMISLSI